MSHETADLKDKQDIFLDFEFWTPEKKTKKIDIRPISIGMITLENNDEEERYYAAYQSARERETQNLILGDEWVKARVWDKLPARDDPAWKTTARIRNDVKDFIFRHPARKVNLWVKGDTGQDNMLFYHLMGGVEEMFKTFKQNGIEFVDIRDSMILRRLFGKQVSSTDIKREIEQEIGAELFNQSLHTANFDSWLEREIYRGYKERITDEQWDLFEKGIPPAHEQ